MERGRRQAIGRDPPSVDSNSKRDPPSEGEEVVEKHRQQARNGGIKNGVKSYSAIRFSNNLEVHNKTSSNQYTSATPTRSILRTKTKGNHASSKLAGRRKDSLLEKNAKNFSRTRTDSSGDHQEPQGPVRPRRDWNIESLFPPSSEKKTESRNMANRSSRVDPTGAIHTRASNIEQYYSSEYLLKKYTVHSSGSPKMKLNELFPKLEVRIPPTECSLSINTSVSSTPTEGEDRHHELSSESRFNEKLNTQARFHTNRIGRKKELSYLQLEENTAYDDPDFGINSGYNLARMVQRYPVDSPRSSMASYDQLLIQKSTSDTDYSDGDQAFGQKQFDWDGLDNDAPHLFDNSDFDPPNMKRQRQIFKSWAVWLLVGTVFVCLASTFIVYLTLMNERGGWSSSDDKLDIDECKHHDQTGGRFSSDRYDTIRYLLLFQPGGNVTKMDQPGSPQREALCWISEFDDYKISATDENKAAIMQRYSLAVIYFSTVKEKRKSRDDLVSARMFNFLSSIHECDWDGVLCNHSRKVTILRLSNQSLTGKIPPEIGNLMSLSTYDRIRWNVYIFDCLVHYSDVSLFTFIYIADFLDLSLNHLTGEIPASISRITSLDYLSLAYNDFETPIPTNLSQLTNLNTLNLRSGAFQQQVPTNLGHIPKLGKLKRRP